MNTFEQLRKSSTRIGIVGLLAVSACGEGPSTPTKGEPAEVVSTEFIPEHTELVDGMCAVASGGVCIMHYQKEEVVEDAYNVTLKQCDKPEDISDVPDCDMHTIWVNSSDYEVAQNSSQVYYTEAGTLERIAD